MDDRGRISQSCERIRDLDTAVGVIWMPFIMLQFLERETRAVDGSAMLAASPA